jgi:hypothetical protein
MKTKDDAIRDFPLLRRNLIALGKLSSQVFNSQIRLPPSSNLRFMMVSYAAKQIEHANSLLKLEFSVDTVLIARSMLEGLVQLLWAMKQARRRPLLWRAFALVVDWRLFQQQKSEGQNIDVAAEARTVGRLRGYRRWFLTDKAKKAIATGKPPPSDPYVKNWYGEREAEIFRDVGAEALYNKLYGPFSEWHHWRIGGFGRLMTFDANTSAYSLTTSDPAMCASALSVGFQCLWETMRLLNRRFRLGIGRNLRRLRTSQIAIEKQNRK